MKLLAIRSKAHGDAFRRYVETTPRLVPRTSEPVEPSTWTVQPRKFRFRLLDSLWFICGTGAMEAIDTLQEAHILPVLWRLY